MSWRVTYDADSAFIVGPKIEARRRIAACGDRSPAWVSRLNAWATSPTVASRVIDQLEARRVAVQVDDRQQSALW